MSKKKPTAAAAAQMVGNSASAMAPVGPTIPPGTWSSDLFSVAAPCPCCESTTLCGMAMCCPSVAFANNTYMLEKNTVLPPGSCIGCCREDCCISFAIDFFATALMNPYLGYMGLGIPIACGLRYGWLAKFTGKKARLLIQRKYNIVNKAEPDSLCRENCSCAVGPEGYCGDSPEEAMAFCSHFWCPCCAHMQEYKTIKAMIDSGVQPLPVNASVYPYTPTDPLQAYAHTPPPGTAQMSR